MLQDAMAVLYKAANEIEAGMITEVLDRAGIPFFQKSRGAGTAYMGSLLCGVYVYVDESDLERAKALIAGIETPSPLPDDFDPNDYELVMEPEK